MLCEYTADEKHFIKQSTLKTFTFYEQTIKLKIEKSTQQLVFFRIKFKCLNEMLMLSKLRETNGVLGIWIKLFENSKSFT